MPAEVIHNDLKVGRYRPVYRGVYAVGPLSPRGRLVAALMAGGSAAGLCFASSLVVFRLMEPRATIDVAVPSGRKDVADLRFHRLSLTGRDLVVRDGLRVTSIERTLLDLASLGVNVDRLAHEALAKRLTTKTKLRNTADEHRGRKTGGAGAAGDRGGPPRPKRPRTVVPRLPH
jgi:hypothetical protein